MTSISFHALYSWTSSKHTRPGRPPSLELAPLVRYLMVECVDRLTMSVLFHSHIRFHTLRSRSRMRLMSLKLVMAWISELATMFTS